MSSNVKVTMMVYEAHPELHHHNCFERAEQEQQSSSGRALQPVPTQSISEKSISIQNKINKKNK